jgi:hypothetical protein
LTKCGRLGVRAEYHQTGIRYYTHSDYPLETRGELLGDPLGPRGLGGYLTLDGESDKAGYIAVTGAFEVRSGNQYTSAADGPDTKKFHFVQTAHFPGEKRTRAIVTWSPETQSRRVGVRLSVGGERVTNAGFVAGSDRTNWLAGAAITARP